jgi:hypothetical protein
MFDENDNYELDPNGNRVLSMLKKVIDLAHSLAEVLHRSFCPTCK